ncbi:unnamed protein product, partial [Rotaria magnacalcarata]
PEKTAAHSSYPLILLVDPIDQRHRHVSDESTSGIWTTCTCWTLITL